MVITGDLCAGGAHPTVVLFSRVTNEAEFDLFVKTFRKFATTLKKDQILLPESKEGTKIGNVFLTICDSFEEKA